MRSWELSLGMMGVFQLIQRIPCEARSCALLGRVKLTLLTVLDFTNSREGKEHPRTVMP